MLYEILGTLSSTICSAQEAPKATFYVATDGNDAWSGKQDAPNEDHTDGPFASISQARDAIREMKVRSEVTGPITVMVRGGTYFLDSPIVFEPHDNGGELHPITYCAYPDEAPIISGGRPINGPWGCHEGEILVCHIPEVERGEWYFRQLFANGKRQVRARFPREGNYLIEEAAGDAAFKYREGDFQAWQRMEDVEVIMFHSWNESRLRVAEVDEEQRLVTCHDPKARHVIGWSGAGGPNRYIIENVLEAVQQPGDWYLDRQTGNLYYWPIAPIEELEIIAPVLNELVRFKGGLKAQNVQHLHLQGFTFAHTDWQLPDKGYPDCGDVGDITDPSAIMLENVRHCSIEDCTVCNVGTYALELTGSSNRISGNRLYDIGGGGIISRSYEGERNEISYNHIHHCGEVYPSSVGINIDDGGGLVAHNLIHDIAHSGIYTRHWRTEHQPIERENQEQGLIIEYNEIFDVMTKINDGGGLFVRDSNIIIRNNLIHDVYSYSSRCPGWGIYLGCETRDTLVENNVVYRAREVVHVWYYDRNITMRNNIFLDGEWCQINYQNPQNLSHENLRTERNIFCYSGDDSQLFRISGERSLPVVSDYNVYFHSKGGTLVNRGAPGHDSFDEWQAKGFDTHSVVDDPLFVDPENDNYSLKPESPAFGLGFKEIDMSAVGLRGRPGPD